MATDPAVPQKHAVLFHGKCTEYLALWLSNLMLTILTLGIYSAWATVRRRRYFYQNTEIDGDRFTYHGRPLDILQGRIIVIAALILLLILSATMPDFVVIFILVFLALMPWLIINRWRYNALMSRYRGQQFNYHCRPARAYWSLYLCPLLLFIAWYLVVSIVGLVASDCESLTRSLVLAGLALMMFIIGLAVVKGMVTTLYYSLYINNMVFANRRFKADLIKRDFIKMVLISILIIMPFIIAAGLMIDSLFLTLLYAMLFAGDWQMSLALMMGNITRLTMILMVLLVGSRISTAWLSVAQRNDIFNKTRLGENIQLKSTAHPLAFIGLMLTNSLLVIFTFGLGTPLAEIRLARYLAQTTVLEGNLALLNVGN